MNELAQGDHETPLGSMEYVDPGGDATPFLTAAQALVRAGAHPAFGLRSRTPACGALAASQANAAMGERLMGMERFVAKRESALRLPLALGTLQLGDGVVLDATLRNQLGRGPEGSPMGAWGWELDRIHSYYGSSLPGGHVPASWPGAALTLMNIAAGVGQALNLHYTPGDNEMPVDPQPDRAFGPGVVAWVWGRMLEGAVIPAARYASWRRRRAAVVAAVMAEGEW
jgi:hypothetical protein